MNASTHRWLADSVAVSSVLMLVTGQSLSYVADPAFLPGNLAADLPFVLGFGVVGWLLWRRLPHNAIGWCFSLAGFTGAVTSLARGSAELALSQPDTPGTVARVGALVDTYSFLVGLPLAIFLPLLLLPDGRLLSRRWRPVLLVVIIGTVLGAMGFLSRPGPIDEDAYRQLTNPFGFAGLAQVRSVLTSIGQLTLEAGAITGMVAVVRRYRRSRGVERQQLRWVAFGGYCAGAGLALGTAAGVILPDGASIFVVFGLSAIPVCVGVAVLRYRLYDLGRVVSRTLSYTVVTALLVGVYLLLVTSLARLLPDSSSLAVAASTLAVAALFQPLRRRVQTAVDHRFNRARYDADRTIES
nr:hypothetical protein [Actinomycetota bacterium]